MSLCKNGQILNCCHPNALMTLTEYLFDIRYQSQFLSGYGIDKAGFSGVSQSEKTDMDAYIQLPLTR